MYQNVVKLNSQNVVKLNSLSWIKHWNIFKGRLSQSQKVIVYNCTSLYCCQIGHVRLIIYLEKSTVKIFQLKKQIVLYELNDQRNRKAHLIKCMHHRFHFRMMRKCFQEILYLNCLVWYLFPVTYHDCIIDLIFFANVHLSHFLFLLRRK